MNNIAEDQNTPTPVPVAEEKKEKEKYNMIFKKKLAATRDKEEVMIKEEEAKIVEKAEENNEIIQKDL